MELKRYNVVWVIWDLNLLIVPYGIETYNLDTLLCSAMLLIVPYGIETQDSGGW